MADFRHKRNGIPISEPRNWKELKITKDFLGEKSDTNINISNLTFAGQEALKIRDRVFNGLNGGIGIFEGDKYEIEVGEVGNPAHIFNGYLDYSDGIEIIGCNEISVALKKRKGGDWLNDVADGFSFRYLESIGVITNSNFVRVPYIINYIPDTMQLIMLGISLFVMTKELIQNVKAIAQRIADLTDAGTPVIGISAGLGAGQVTAWDIGNIILTVLKLAAQIAYTIAIVFAIKKLIEQILEELIPKKRDHLGMRLIDLFKKACEHLGLGFSSTLLQSRKDWVIIPQKGHKGGEKPTGYKGSWSESGVPTEGSSNDTFGDLIRTWKKNLYADYRIIDGVFHFEREDYWKDESTFTVPDFWTDQDELVDRWKPNTSEVISNYNIYWAYDTQDQNTLDNQQGRVFQAILEPKTIANRDLVTLKNLEQVAINCSLGLRKNELTGVEKFLKGVAKFIDKLTGIFGNGTNYANKIEARRGSLLLSSHFLTRPKMVVMQGSKLAKNQRELLSAKRLWDELHYINSFAEINGEHNQWRRYEKVRVPFCIKDFVSLLENNYAKSTNGEEAMIERLEWKVWEDYATIDYRINKKYTDNLRIKQIAS